MNQQQLIALREEVNRILGRLERRSIEGSINWLDLRCVCARWGIDNYGDTFTQVQIEEASPINPQLQVHVHEELKKVGYDDVVVLTEW